MDAGSGIGSEGAVPFHVHRGHRFEGFELVDRRDGPQQLIARCECGAALDVAEARFAPCPDCSGDEPACTRCDGSGRVINHAALEWQALGD